MPVFSYLDTIEITRHFKKYRNVNVYRGFQDFKGWKKSYIDKKKKTVRINSMIVF